jgi:hypothetical protein
MLKKLRRAYIVLIVATRLRFANAQRASARARYARSVYLAERTRANKLEYSKRKRLAAVRWRTFRRSREEREEAKRIYTAAKVKTPREKFMEWQYRWVGTTEATGNNDGPDILRWQRHTARGGNYFDRAPYCGIGQENAAAAIGCETSPRWAAVAYIEDDARAGRNGFDRWVPRGQEGTIGDDEIVLVVLFGRGVHVEGLDVDGFKSDHVDTVGFNTSPGTAGSQSNGGGVWRRRGNTGRLYSQVHGYAVVKTPK